MKAVATRFLKLSNFKQRPNLQNEGVMSSNLLDMPLDVINVVMGKLEPMDLWVEFIISGVVPVGMLSKFNYNKLKSFGKLPKFWKIWAIEKIQRNVAFLDP